MEIGKVVLEGVRVRLEPLAVRHAAELFEAAQDDEVWRYMPVPRPASVGDVERWVADAVRMAERGEAFAFAHVEVAGGRAVGSTRFMDVRWEHRGVEIGWTWIGREWWRTAVNTEAKLLMLGYAFEVWGMGRVQLKTDGRNVRSQRAIERLGAVKEGVLRKHIVCWDGFVRDSVMYSVVAEEWPAVKAGLERRMRREEGGAGG